jgi:hypothetical protein
VRAGSLAWPREPRRANSGFATQHVDPLAATPAQSPGSVFRAHRGRILTAHALLNLENLLHLAQPWALGLAVQGLLESSFRELLVLGAQHLGYVAVAAWRRKFDAAVFTDLYAALAERVVQTAWPYPGSRSRA